MIFFIHYSNSSHSKVKTPSAHIIYRKFSSKLLFIYKQVEKSFEMKKCSRNGTAKIKKTRYRKVYNVNSHTSMLDGFYLTTQYQGECGHIEGHAYSVSH